MYLLDKVLQLQQRERHKCRALNFWGIGFKNSVFYIAEALLITERLK